MRDMRKYDFLKSDMTFDEFRKKFEENKIDPNADLSFKVNNKEFSYPLVTMPIVYSRTELEQKIQFLIAKGINPNKKYTDFHRNTVLHAVIANEAFADTEMLIRLFTVIDAKIKLDLTICDVNKRTALHLAAMTMATDIAKLLIDNGAPVNASDKDGKTALHIAAITGNLDLFNCLVQKGAMLDLNDKDGRTAIDFLLLPLENRKKITESTLQAIDIDPKRDEKAVSNYMKTPDNQELAFGERKVPSDKEILNHFINLQKQLPAGFSGKLPVDIFSHVSSVASKFTGTSVLDKCLKGQEQILAREFFSSCVKADITAAKKMLHAMPSLIEAKDEKGRNAVHLSLLRTELALKQFGVVYTNDIVNNKAALFGILVESGAKLDQENISKNTPKSLLEKQMNSGDGISHVDQLIAKACVTKLNQQSQKEVASPGK